MGLCPSVGVFFPPLLPLIRSTITATDYSRSSYLQRHTEAQELGSRADYNTRRLQLFGDVARADQAEDHCKHLSAHLERRPRGRRRQTWLPTISDDLKHLNIYCIYSAYCQAQDRPSWRKIDVYDEFMTHMFIDRTCLVCV